MKLEAVIMDMAGTCVDFGSLAPIQAFMQLFAQQGVPLSQAQVREPMGSEKREHIRQLLAMPAVASQWQAATGQAPTAGDIDRLYAEFLPLQLATIRARAQLIPGCLTSLEFMEQQGIKLGLNTGYNREMVNAMLASLTEQGLKPSSLVCAPEVPMGRPYPHMSLKNALELSVSSVQQCLKADDTLMGIEEGRRAGMWTVAFAISGNALGMDLGEWQALTPKQQQQARATAQAHFGGQAHYLVDSVADLPGVIQDINARLAQGERP